ncbi:MAG: hypothetical protein KDE68_05560 [Rhodocyclaceae bacterium]|nr:hypothetical protein [Rhodocyclaceae bacterium]
MSFYKNPFRNPFIFLPETESADRVLDQADALLQRHRGATDPDGDLPVLTEVVEDANTATQPLPLEVDPAVAAPAGDVPANYVEQLIELDAIINRRVDAWLHNELPELLDQVMESVKDGLRDEIHAHMRSTLLSDISQEISQLLDANDPRAR